jgi:MraZ protein
MLTGSLATKIDAKGRLKIPLEFRSYIESKFGTTFYITSMNSQTARIYPYPVWEENAKIIEETSTMSIAMEKFAFITSFYGKIVEMDSQGRVLLPALIRNDATLDGEVVLLGMTYYLEVRRMDEAREEVRQTKIGREERQELKEQGVK